MLRSLRNYSYIKFLPTANDSQHRGAKSLAHKFKFEDAGFKCQFSQRLDSMLDAAPAGLLQVNRGADANRLNDLLTFMSNAILKLRVARKYLGCGNLQNSMCQGVMSEQRN